MNNYVSDHLEEQKHKALEAKKNRIKIELDMLYYERATLEHKIINHENDKRTVH